MIASLARNGRDLKRGAQAFFEHEAAGGIILILAAVVADGVELKTNWRSASAASAGAPPFRLALLRRTGACGEDGRCSSDPGEEATS